MNFQITGYFWTSFLFEDKYFPWCLAFASCALFCVSYWLPFMLHEKTPWAHGIGFILLLEKRKWVLRKQIISFLAFCVCVCACYKPSIDRINPNLFHWKGIKTFRSKSIIPIPSSHPFLHHSYTALHTQQKLKDFPVVSHDFGIVLF